MKKKPSNDKIEFKPWNDSVCRNEKCQTRQVADWGKSRNPKCYACGAQLDRVWLKDYNRKYFRNPHVTLPAKPTKQ